MTNQEILDDFGHLVGKAYSECLRMDIAEQTGRTVRYCGLVLETEDHRSDRLNIRVNNDGIISGFLFI
ncbi:hypothetical protein [Pseudomonas serbica]|uniref:hypothetical protein n=1 Tax=Pseudomonas serbica TaxID=2965074 RepID=UPI00237B3771|nr:hypothetical protein [Pseudomonas serbica]